MRLSVVCLLEKLAEENMKNNKMNLKSSSIKKMLPAVGISNEKNRIAWTIKALKKIPKGSKILDAGAGEQQFKTYCQHLKYVSQDFAEYDGKGDKSGFQTGTWNNSGLDIISDITAIPRPSKSFDAILCTEVFEHLPDPIAAIKEFSRLLKKEGILIITAPFGSLTHFAPYHFYNGFNIYFYKKFLSQFGFEIIELKRNGNYFEYLAQEVYRLNFISKKYAKKIKLGLFSKMVQYFFLKVLARLSINSRGSEELLCFGYFVRAKKI
jgi:ubiquinone/menaquinone biosynthesis C-methylase UbiE